MCSNAVLKLHKVGLILPAYNAGIYWPAFWEGLERQSLQVDRLLCIDSGSQDDTVSKAKSSGFEVIEISNREFNHGGTRQMGFEMLGDCDVVIFLTQDAILAEDHALANIVASFANDQVGAAYGRQLPAADASPIASHARLFNYPPERRVTSASDIPLLGMKSAFLSNSFAAYRRVALESVGGFPLSVIFGEDSYVAAKMLQKNWGIAYCPNAQVLHSHNYSLTNEFSRYFDIGVFHSREKWFKNLLGKAEGEGKRFVSSEFKYLLTRSPRSIPASGIRTCFKLAAYRLGLLERILPKKLRAKLSMNKAYWK